MLAAVLRFGSGLDHRADRPRLDYRFGAKRAARGPTLARQHESDGLVRVKSAYPMRQTVDRLKKAIAAKGLPFFGSIDQAGLAADAGVKLRPSTLLVFGHPSLGAQFLSSNPYAGLDWPIRLLVLEDAAGRVWVAYTDFGCIARRRGISDRPEQFALASALVDSIAATVRATSWAS
jgi:uncharacterized protein (DUF302 family)